MRIKLTLFIVALLTSLSGQALTLDKARQLARDRYPLIRDYALIDLTEQYNVDNAAKAWLPQLNIGGQALYQSSVISYPDALVEILDKTGLKIKGIDRFQWKLSAEVNQTIWDGGRIKASQNVSRREAEESRLSIEVEMHTLQNRVDELYFGLLLMINQKEAIENTIELLQGNLNRINALVNNGAAMVSDADAVNAELLTTRQQLTSITATIDTYRNVLALYVGEAAHETLSEPSEPSIPATNNSYMRPEQLLMNARIATNNAKAEQIKASVMPQFGAFAQGNFGYPGANFMDAMVNRNPALFGTIGITASWNIGALYTRKNKLRTLETANERIQVSREVFEFNTSIQSSGDREEINRLRLISEDDKEIVALRTRVRKAAEARLSEGIVEPTDLLLRITDERNARISAVSHRIQYIQAIYKLKSTVNE